MPFIPFSAMRYRLVRKHLDMWQALLRFEPSCETEAEQGCEAEG